METGEVPFRLLLCLFQLQKRPNARAAPGPGSLRGNPRGSVDGRAGPTALPQAGGGRGEGWEHLVQSRWLVSFTRVPRWMPICHHLLLSHRHIPKSSYQQRDTTECCGEHGLSLELTSLYSFLVRLEFRRFVPGTDYVSTRVDGCCPLDLSNPNMARTSQSHQLARPKRTAAASASPLALRPLGTRRHRSGGAGAETLPVRGVPELRSTEPGGEGVALGVNQVHEGRGRIYWLPHSPNLMHENQQDDDILPNRIW